MNDVHICLAEATTFFSGRGLRGWRAVVGRLKTSPRPHGAAQAGEDYSKLSKVGEVFTIGIVIGLQ
jgi:hypothetical protein